MNQLIDSNGKKVEILKWQSKYCALIDSICLIELVQIDEISMNENIPPPADPLKPIKDPQKANLYMLQF